MFAILCVAVVFVVFLFCLSAFFRQESSAQAKKLTASATTILTSTGIFFTFLGISWGLWGFDVREIDSGIDRLLSGMQTAFFSSVAGLFFALLFRVIQISAKDSATNKSEVDASDIYEILSRNNELLKEELRNLSEALGGERDTSVVGQLTRIRTTLQDKLDELIKEFKTFAEKMAEDNSKALIEALESVIRDFNSQLNEQFGDNFKQLNEAVKELVTWQENYRLQIEELTKAFETSKESLQEIDSTVEGIATNTKKIPAHMDALKEIQESLAQQIGDLSETVNTFATIKIKAEEAFPAIEETMTNVMDNLDKSSGDFVEKLSNMLDRIEQAILKGANDLDSSVNQLDAEMEKEVKRVVQIMASNITSITEEFVAQYEKFMKTNQNSLK